MSNPPKVSKAVDKGRNRWYNNKAVRDGEYWRGKLKKFFEKVLDKSKTVWYNIKVADSKVRNEFSKKFEKVLKKDLTNERECDIISKLHERAMKQMVSWKLNNARKNDN